MFREKINTESKFVEQTKDIIIDNNREFVQRLKQTHNEILNSNKEKIEQEKKELIILLLHEKYLSNNEEENNEIKERIENLANKLLEKENNIIIQDISSSGNLADLESILSEK